MIVCVGSSKPEMHPRVRVKTGAAVFKLCMKPRAAIAASVLAMALPFSAPRAFAQAGSVAEQYLFAQANAERAQRGLQPLHWDNALYQAAQRHCAEMARRESISHQYTGEPDLAERGNLAGAHFSHIAENVAEAGTAVRIHDAWMNSPGHRENLLDAVVDSVGISVMRRNGQLYAVQDFGRTVTVLTFDAQEEQVANLVASASLVQVGSSAEARRTCSMETGYAGQRQPWFVIRYTAGTLDKLPDQLVVKLNSGKFKQAAVGACSTRDKQPFSSYSIAVLLYP